MVESEEEFEAVSTLRKNDLLTVIYIDAINKCTSFEENELVVSEALNLENNDRKKFATGVSDFAQYHSLIPVFSGENNRSILENNRHSYPEECVVPRMFVKKQKGRPTELTLDLFKENFEDAFGSDILKHINWNNVVAAGGSVSGCLQPVPPTRRHNRRLYFNHVYLPNSDIDLYIYGLDADSANKKITDIYEAICLACPHEVMCIRTVNAVTMISQYPYRHVQIILRLYSSPYEVLAGFDVDSCCVLYDGKQVWMSPRSHSAFVSGSNRVDLLRRSPTYETRLAKYAERGFEVRLPRDGPLFAGDWRTQINPTLHLVHIGDLKGLALLLRLENSAGNKEYRRKEHSTNIKRKGVLNLIMRDIGRVEKLAESVQDMEISDYTVVFLPWGPGYNARSIVNQLIKRNETVNQLKEEVGVHTFFWGTAKKILTDCAPNDFFTPSESQEKHVHGPLTWMRYNPGQQMIGSFHPLSPDDWAKDVFLDPRLLSFSTALELDDHEAIVRLDYIPDEINDVPTLHAAMYAGAFKCVEALLKKLNDWSSEYWPEGTGKNILHIAALLDSPEVAACAIREAEDKNKMLNEVWRNNHFALTPLQTSLYTGNARVLDIILREPNNIAGLFTMFRMSPNMISPLLLIRQKTITRTGEIADVLLKAASAQGNKILEDLIIFDDLNNNVFSQSIKHQNHMLLSYLLQTPLISDELRRKALLKEVNGLRAIDTAVQMVDLESMELIYSVIRHQQFSLKFDPVRYVLTLLMNMIGSRLGMIIPANPFDGNKNEELMEFFTVTYPVTIHLGRQVLDEDEADEDRVVKILEWLLRNGCTMYKIPRKKDSSWDNLEKYVSEALNPTSETTRKRQRMVNGARTFARAFDLAKTAAETGGSLEPFKDFMRKCISVGDCSICWESFDSKPTTEMINCTHRFHVSCIDTWKKENIENSCPLCRTPFTSRISQS